MVARELPARRRERLLLRHDRLLHRRHPDHLGLRLLEAGRQR
jgi:hypothetical protein